MTTPNAEAIAQNLTSAYALGRTDVDPPSSCDSQFDLAAGYAVQAELTRLRREAGRRIVGWKVGYANKAVWQALKLDTLTWAPMWDDTVVHAVDGAASLSMTGRSSPKIEPEVVIKLKAPVAAAAAAAVLHSAEWLAIGFEIIDCVFADWKFHPPDFVAAFGLHAALFVGEPREVVPNEIAALVEQLAQFKIQLRRNKKLVEEGSGKNSLRSPALAAAELVSAMSHRGSDVVQPGQLISTGTLTSSQPIAAGDIWTTVIDGINLPPLSLHVRP